MNLAPRSPQPRRAARHIVLALLAVGALFGLTQCKLSGDKLTGVNKAKPSNHGTCISNCAHEANQAKQLEQDLHVANVQACNGDPTCLANEEARHEAAVEAIQAERKRCMDSCHEQGGGNSR